MKQEKTLLLKKERKNVLKIFEKKKFTLVNE